MTGARLLLLAGAVLVAVAGCGGDARAPTARAPVPAPAPLAAAQIDAGTALTPLAVRLHEHRDLVRLHLAQPPRAGLLFDVDTGRVLWRRRPRRRAPIASLTKMMTALLSVARIPPHSRVHISAHALHYSGSGVGVLPKGKDVSIKVMLHGLLLVSGNDAARALAENAGGTIRHFVTLMNRRADAMGLGCTHYVSPDGLDDRNRSCAADLAALARAVLREPRLARVVRKRHVILRWSGKGGHLELWSTNPLLRANYPGVNGVKTGYTEAAGRCLVASARRGNVRLAVVLLDSPDPAGQAARLLDRGFRVSR